MFEWLGVVLQPPPTQLRLPGAPADLPAHQSTAGNTVLAWADQLPFKSNSIDYIISLHNLEHLWNPVAAVLHYLVCAARGCSCTG